MITYYKVGGYVRDALLGIPSKDIDYAVEAESFESMIDDLNRLGAEIFVIKPEYLTVRAKLNGGAADFVLCRKDGVYSDARRPDQVEPGDIFDDLARRDFTVNAIAVREDGTFLDPHNGLGDINGRILRCVGSATERFSEDALRILRAIRFEITKGFHLDYDITDALRDSELLAKLQLISVERIREELNRCFAHDTLATLKVLDRYHKLRNALFTFHPGLTLEATLKQR